MPAPRTGAPQAEIALAGGGLALNLASSETGPGYSDAGQGWKKLTVGAASDYLAARAWTQSTARALLPARR